MSVSVGHAFIRRCKIPRAFMIKSDQKRELLGRGHAREGGREGG